MGWPDHGCGVRHWRCDGTTTGRPGRHLVLHTGSNRAALERAARLPGPGRTDHAGGGDLASAARWPNCSAAGEVGRPLQAVVANAGYALDPPLMTLDPDRLSEVMQFMVVGLTRLMQAALPMLARAPGGRFVAVSSFVAHRFNLPGAVYPATASAKAAVEALVKAAAREVAATGTTVHAVAPGFVRKTSSRWHRAGLLAAGGRHHTDRPNRPAR
jgi:NAD(P)-dependent dehydrogenase (short-subunit alcohol dehydrogenase family)